MSQHIWVYIDHFKGQALTASWEALGAAQSLAAQFGGKVKALILGAGVANLAQDAFAYGADEVLLADDAALADFRAEVYADVIKGLAADLPAVFLLPTTTRGRDLAAMAAVDFNAGVLVDVTAMEVTEGVILATRPVYAGKLLSKVQCSARPQIVTLRSRAFAKPEPDSTRIGTLTPISISAAGDAQTQVVSYAEASTGVSLNDAAVIVSGGRGVSDNPEQGFTLVGELAKALGGAVGASRAAVDAGFVPYIHQVGQTGKVVSPDLYIACGISGAIQHLAGMRTSKVIVAVNKDPDAPIFKLARYGVVGDLFVILPALTRAFAAKLTD